MGTTVDDLLEEVPALRTWLRRVFWVLGGFVASTGILVLYVAQTAVRDGGSGAVGVVAAAGLASAGWMTVVNFMIRSASRWALLALSTVWALGCWWPGNQALTVNGRVEGRTWLRLSPGGPVTSNPRQDLWP